METSRVAKIEAASRAKALAQCGLNRNSETRGNAIAVHEPNNPPTVRWVTYAAHMEKVGLLVKLIDNKNSELTTVRAALLTILELYNDG